MNIEYIVCKLAIERCQHNMSHLCALLHLGEDQETSKELMMRQGGALNLIDVINQDLRTLQSAVDQGYETELPAIEKSA